MGNLNLFFIEILNGINVYDSSIFMSMNENLEGC